MPEVSTWMLAVRPMLAFCELPLPVNASVKTSGSPDVFEATLAPVAEVALVKLENFARAPEGGVAVTVTVIVFAAALPVQGLQTKFKVATVTVPVVSRFAPVGVAGD